jgi:hypothetical protein
MSNKVASFEEGWNIIHKGIKKTLEGLPNPRFTSEEYMEIYEYGFIYLFIFLSFYFRTLFGKK